MTPARQIQDEVQKVEAVITELLTNLEMETGIFVNQVRLVDFINGDIRRTQHPLKVGLVIELPPITGAKG